MLLLAAPAAATLKSKDGQTPLHSASLKGYGEKVIQALIEAFPEATTR